VKYLVDINCRDGALLCKSPRSTGFSNGSSQMPCRCSGATCKVALQGQLSSFGATEGEALVNLREAVELYLDGMVLAGAPES
jgi:hypothetical protein